MDSFAIWYDGKNKIEESKKPIVTLNYNLWKLDDLQEKKFYNKTLFNYVLDIGMKLECITNIEEIYLYVPFKIKMENIKDLGHIMIENKKVIDGVFNENCKVTKSGYESSIEVEIPRKEGKNEKVKIFVLDAEWQNNIELKQKSEGTVLSIKLSIFSKSNQDDDETKSYFRFRIHGDELKQLVENKKIKDNMFKTYSEKNDIIDFRVNEKKSMPDSLVNLINSKMEFKIKEIHFLLLMDMKYTLAATGLNYSVRALETKIWDNYLDSEIKNARFVGYHWKTKAKKEDDCIENFNSLIRIEDKKTNTSTILWYIFGVILLSIFSNFLYELCKEALIKLFNNVFK